MPVAGSSAGPTRSPNDSRVAPMHHVAAEPLPVQLMNTVRADRGVVRDALTTPGELRAWLRSVCPHDTVRGADLERFRVLRDALRRLAAVVTTDDRPAAA